MNLKTIKDIDVRGKKVIMRVDFNVPMNAQGEITDDTRITSSLPTIHNLLGREAKIILISHLGRPKGFDEKLSLKPIAQKLAELLQMDSIQVCDVKTPKCREIINNMEDKSIVMLENIRFYDEERKDFMGFAKELASLGDIYVNDAFGVCHRAHASVVGIAEFLPSVAGLLLEEEIRFLNIFLARPAKPISVIIGGKKASSKIAVIDKFLEKADTVMVGGGCANTFLRTWGYNIGNSVSETEMLDTSKRLIWKASHVNTAMLMPLDLVIANSFNKDSTTKIVDADNVPDNWIILDIGPKTITKYVEEIKKSGTIIWAGPLGMFEDERFAKGTHEILNTIVKCGANSITGGGDTIAAMKKYPELMKQITHVSTGGGAMLEFIEKGTLPGIEVLEKL